MIRRAIIPATLLILIFLAAPLSAVGGQSMPWESGLQKVLNALSGPTAKIIGAILIIAGGLAVAATEGQAVKKFLWIIVGLGIALNATSLMSMLFGTSSGSVIGVLP